jgi:hypothetical protein
MRLRRRDLALAAAAAALARPASALAQPGDDELLQAAIEIERRLAIAYGGEPGERFEQAPLFARQCREHARGLGIALRNRGGRVPPDGGSVPVAASVLAIENEATRMYHDAIGELRDGRLLPIFVAVMANHGQHLVVLRERLGRDPIPAAFETGFVQ